MPPKTFEEELEVLINKYSQDVESGTPDFILAKFILGCLHAFRTAVKARENWFGRVEDDKPETVKS